jgi:N-acetylglutamate synthase-like GNAT family acetyltransferase
MAQLVWLEEHMQHSDALAESLYCQFAYEYADQTLAQWQQEFAEGQRDGRWKCLFALDQGQLSGCAALARQDLAQRPDLGPWLACVWVQPKARGAGLAAQLIDAICSHARETGVATLYLHTQDQSGYYARRGWQTLGRFDAWGKEQWLMARRL